MLVLSPPRRGNGILKPAAIREAFNEFAGKGVETLLVFGLLFGQRRNLSIRPSAKCVCQLPMGFVKKRPVQI
jgi:hypothetical protein